MELTIGQRIFVTVERLVFGGDGLAKYNGFILFIPRSAALDELEVELTEIKKSFGRAKIVQIIKASPERRETPCKYLSPKLNHVCGGCDWQHLNYSHQLQWKEKIVQETLKKHLEDDSQVLPIFSSPKELAYRNRIQLKNKSQKVGYFGADSHQLVPIDSCLIADKALSDHIQNPSFIQKIKKNESENIQKIELSLNRNNTVKEVFNSSNLSEPNEFSQVNEACNEVLINQALEWTSHLKKIDMFLDLYAGMGNFTFPIYNKLKPHKTMAVEWTPGSVEIANQKIKDEQLKSIRFYAGDVGSFLRRFNSVENDNSLICLDPPRGGCDLEVIKYLAALNFKNILYVSCNPTTLSRDLDWLKNFSNNAYQVKKMTTFDMFPQTHHVETMVLLERRG
jgi:23S rRNA (uracil1939-C5)-methyltransferase